MEANTQLMRIIQEMRAEINKLERENSALRVKLASVSQPAPGSGGQSDGRKEAVRGSSPPALHGATSTDSTPAGQEHQDNVMIVRRYSTSSSVHSLAAKDPWEARNRDPGGGILEAPGAVTSLACSSTKKQGNEEKMLAANSPRGNNSSQRESDLGCRDKIKTVSFQLSRDMPSLSNNSASLKFSPNQTTNQPSTAAEKDV
uniref:putative coiled-coil domain-containing protein 195 n=1 Tax=Jaculus jaculus TaxID=51337 RepID=UPI001E1B4223|nr:putative coiled-coil domain-containing protein 195 [Jaculus jaculus]